MLLHVNCKLYIVNCILLQFLFKRFIFIHYFTHQIEKFTVIININQQDSCKEAFCHFIYIIRSWIGLLIVVFLTMFIGNLISISNSREISQIDQVFYILRSIIINRINFIFFSLIIHDNRFLMVLMFVKTREHVNEYIFLKLKFISQVQHIFRNEIIIYTIASMFLCAISIRLKARLHLAMAKQCQVSLHFLKFFETYFSKLLLNYLYSIVVLSLIY